MFPTRHIDHRSDREKLEDEIHELEEMKCIMLGQQPRPSNEALLELDNLIRNCKNKLSAL